VEVVATLSQGRTAAAQCGLFTHKSVPVIFEPPCIRGKDNIPLVPIQQQCFVMVADSTVLEYFIFWDVTLYRFQINQPRRSESLKYLYISLFNFSRNVKLHTQMRSQVISES